MQPVDDLVVLRKQQPCLVVVLHHALADTVAGVYVAEEDKEHHAEDGERENHEHPRHLVGWVDVGIVDIQRQCGACSQENQIGIGIQRAECQKYEYKVGHLNYDPKNAHNGAVEHLFQDLCQNMHNISFCDWLYDYYIPYNIICQSPGEIKKRRSDAALQFPESGTM